MPICKRQGFDISVSGDRNEHFHDNEEVFYCEVTKQIFRQYEDYFRHVMVINSTVWQCEATGRENLTYDEALKSERRAHKKMELFKDSLRPPVMLVIDHAKQSSLKALNEIVSKFLRRRYFINEQVTIAQKSSNNTFKVVEIVPPEKTPPANGVYEETDKLQYKLCGVGKQMEMTVPFENVRRQRFEFTAENLQMFIKNNVTRIDGILRPKPESYKKYIIDRKITFSSIFIGKMPHFTPAKIKRPLETANKKQSTLNKYLVKSAGEQKSSKLSAEELAKKEMEKIEKANAKAKALKDEMERLRKEKQERIAEQERQKVEKRAKLMVKIEAECTALLTKTDDLERSDQRLLPVYQPVQTCIPTKFLGDAFIMREFMFSFVGILSRIEVFRPNLSFYEMSRALTVREIAGPLSDIILIFLGTIFDLQKEEEDECTVEYLKWRKEMCTREPFKSMSQASRTHFYAKRHYASKINELPIDSLSLTEVLRLHLLSSGALVNERAEKWRAMYRNGYASSEDPGFTLRMQYPHILRALKIYTVYQLPFTDILRIIECLISQILTYSSPISVIEDRMEKMAKARIELRSLTAAENRRLANVQANRRTMLNEHNQQCLDDAVKNDQEKKRQLEEKLNKRIAELLVQSEREHKKFEQQLEKQNIALFDYLVFLGMDRAYRKYYVFESMPGIFVEHPTDCMDTCLENPPINEISTQTTNPNLPKNRKDLRSYLLKMYLDAEKKAAVAAKANIKGDKLVVSQENKENQANGLVNGLTADHDAVKINGIESKHIDEASECVPPKSNPTQNQLYMCTGDRTNCIVHDGFHKDRQLWAYFYEREDIDALIESLNPLGEREAHLREQLTVLRLLILNHVKKCPSDLLSINAKDEKKFKSQMITETYRKYNKSNYGFPEGADLNEVMYAALVDRILQFESEIYTGDLGRLKVKDMEKWRTDLQNSSYDSQVKLQWGPKTNKLSNGVVEDDDDLYDDPGDDESEGGRYANSPYRDPGEVLGDSVEIVAEDSSDEGSSLHEPATLCAYVKNLASALLQVEQAIERRFLKEPFGPPLKEVRDKEVLERKLKASAARLKQWEVSLMECTSYSQVFLHLSTLHDSIIWSRSTNKSSCQVCRRGSEPDKMLLCDECNGGTHMFCMKPKMRTVPKGNWYCKRCCTRLGLKNEEDIATSKVTPKRKSAFIIEEEDNLIDASSESSMSNDSEPRVSGRAAQRGMRNNEIEEQLEEDDDEQDDLQEDGETSEENEDEESIAEEEIDASAENTENLQSETEESEAEEDREDDENVCIVCSYDGGDLFCIRCKDVFHLECINLKRPPRYNFICTKCKTNEGKQRKRQENGYSSDDDDEPTSKRSRQSRSSLRNSLTSTFKFY